MRNRSTSRTDGLFTAASVAAVILGLGAFLVPSAASARVSVFVSNSGSDVASCGAETAPCRTIAYALKNVVSEGGSILINDDAILSSAITITKSVSIVSAGGRVSIRSNSNFGVRVAAGAGGRVVLRGLTINGVNGSTIGIQVLSAASLAVIDCLVENSVGDGIKVEPNTALKYDITNTTVLDNGGHGILIAPRSGGSAVGSIVNGEVHRNRGGLGGIAVNGSGGGTAIAHIQNTRSNSNTGVGFAKVTNGSFYLATSTATGNGNNIGSFGGGGPGYSYQNNFLLGNTSDNGTSFLTNVSPQ